MKKVVYYFILFLAVLVIPLSIFGITNTMVSVKYETEYGDGCISLTSGNNLCHIILFWQILLILCVLIIVSLLLFKQKIMNKNLRKSIKSALSAC
jgi:hypothetical protein